MEEDDDEYVDDGAEADDLALAEDDELEFEAMMAESQLMREESLDDQMYEDLAELLDEERAEQQVSARARHSNANLQCLEFYHLLPAD